MKRALIFSLLAVAACSGTPGNTTIVDVTSDAGIRGPVGPEGSAGPQGPMGVMGEAGSQGPQGKPGFNGEAGAQGKQGIPGLNGTNGEAGPLGQQGLMGIPGTSGTNGINGVNGSNGSIGATGSPGTNSLVLEIPEPAGVNCIYGGIKIESGLDTNQDSILESSEITDVSYVCNGVPGPQGPQGEAGIQGPPGPAGSSNQLNDASISDSGSSNQLNDASISDSGSSNINWSSCGSDLANIGTRNFLISFTMSTTMTGGVALLNQRSICKGADFWDIRANLPTTNNGCFITMELDDSAGNYINLYDYMPVDVVLNDNKYHSIVITRISGVLTISVDNTYNASTTISTSFGNDLPPLVQGTDACDNVDGTQAFVGSLANVCIRT